MLLLTTLLASYSMYSRSACATSRPTLLQSTDQRLVSRGRNLELALQSLHLAVLRYHPRPVLLFYCENMPAAESAPRGVDKIAQPEIRNVVKVNHDASQARVVSTRLQSEV